MGYKRKKFNFGDLVRFSFSNLTVREVRRRDIMNNLEKKYGERAYRHIKDIVGMS